MPSDKQVDRPAGSEDEESKDLRSPAVPAPQPHPPILNGGLESPRSSHC
jgi:hypothetical protein